MNTPNHHSLQSGNHLELHLDGRRLRAAFDSVVDCTEKLGGLEIVVEGLIGKSLLFQRTFGNAADCMLETEFFDTCAFIPTIRRRMKSVLEKRSFDEIRRAVNRLLKDVSIENVDQHVEIFESELKCVPKDRWVRDLAAEILHYREPDVFPLMTRWIWDRRSNSGVLREIWFSDSETEFIDVPDGVHTHLELRRELSAYLDGLGVYKNVNFMIDVLFAWIYSLYIDNQGGSFLKTEFGFTGTQFDYVFRMLGLDAAFSSDGKSKLLLADGRRYSLSETIDAVVH